jgi:hypothetical protein
LTQREVQAAQTQAQQMLQRLESSTPNVTQDSPTPAYVLEDINQHLVIKPVVLGLTDSTSYEVLAGLSSGDHVVTASQQVSRSLFGGGLLKRIGK